MADVQGLSGEGIRLNFNVGLADSVDERGLTDVWIACDQDCSFVGVDSGKTT